jgi:hypothetical protein
LRLEAGEVQDQGIRLDLAEVRVHRRDEPHAGRDREREIEPEVRDDVGQPRPRFALARGRPRHRARRQERRELEVPSVRDRPHLHRGEARYESAGAERDQRPREDFVRGADLALDVRAEDARTLGGEADRRERDRELRAPARRRERHGSLPHGVPVEGLLHVVVVQPVLENAARAHGEPVCGAPVARGVDRDGHGVAPGRDEVTAAEWTGDVLGALVVAGERDVEELVVIEEPDLRTAPRRGALAWKDLHERVEDRRRGPGGLVRSPVDPYRAVQACGAKHGVARKRRRRTRSRRRGNGREQRGQQGDRERQEPPGECVDKLSVGRVPGQNGAAIRPSWRSTSTFTGATTSAPGRR